MGGEEQVHASISHWFAVYRPTSRDAINKMLNGIAVGKGLNVKGKSALRKRLSGFVPFLQISLENHKVFVEASPPDAFCKIFFTTDASRITARKVLEPLLDPKEKLNIKKSCRNITDVDTYEGFYGLKVPLAVVREAFIMRTDISFQLGWETGRNSEPDFMNMNLHALYEGGKPEVVLYQIDSENPINPHGFLIAYAESTVKPVVSDFDTFTVGSRHMSYEEIDSNHVKYALWSLSRAKEILQRTNSQQWNSCWLDILRDASRSREGFCPEIPPYGFGDRISTNLIAQIVQATLSVGAIRHSSECFNYIFPQDFDDEYLIIWDKFPDKPWSYKSEEDLREFLLERINDGYSFPLNPVWPARDPNWFQVFEALRARTAKSDDYTFDAWYPPNSGIVEKIIELAQEFPEGFRAQAAKQRASVMDLPDNLFAKRMTRMSEVLEVVCEEDEDDDD